MTVVCVAQGGSELEQRALVASGRVVALSMPLPLRPVLNPFLCVRNMHGFALVQRTPWLPA